MLIKTYFQLNYTNLLPDAIVSNSSTDGNILVSTISEKY